MRVSPRRVARAIWSALKGAAIARTAVGASLHARARTPSRLGSFAALALLGSVVVSGAVASGAPPGNNGTVKIHAQGTEPDDPRTQPHSCVFSVHGFGFDPASTGEFSILSWPPSPAARELAESGVWGPSDTTGFWQTELMTLPDGHYKLFAEQLAPPAPGGAKQKTFWVECGPTPVIPEPSAAVLVSSGAALLFATGLLARRRVRR